MDITSLLSGLSNGRVDGNMAETISSCFNNEEGQNNNWWLILIVLLFAGGGFGFGGNGGCGCGNYGGCGAPGGFYTYYDPCVNGCNCGCSSNLNYVQPNYGCNYSQPNYNNSQCNGYGSGGYEIFFLIILIFIIGGNGFNSNRNRNRGECSNIDFTAVN